MIEAITDPFLELSLMVGVAMMLCFGGLLFIGVWYWVAHIFDKLTRKE